MPLNKVPVSGREPLQNGAGAAESRGKTTNHAGFASTAFSRRLSGSTEIGRLLAGDFALFATSIMAIQRLPRFTPRNGSGELPANLSL